MKRILFCALLFTALHSAAQVSYRKYTGVIQDMGGSEQQIVFDLSQNDSLLTAQCYFPKTRGTAIYSGNVRKDGTLYFRQEDKSGKRTPVEITANRNGITISGDWTSGKESAAISLTEDPIAGSVKLAGMRYDSVCVARKKTATLEQIEAHYTVGVLVAEGMADIQAQNRLNSLITSAWIAGKPPQKWDTAAARVMARESASRIFKDYMSAYDTLRMNTPPQDFEDNLWTFGWYDENFMSVVLNDENLLCISMAGSSYTGGAHGSYFNSYSVFDTKNGKELGLAQLFKPGSEVKLRKLAEQRLREEAGLQPGQTLSDAGYLVDELELSSNIYINRAGIGFFYNPYEITPWAMGAAEVFLPYAQIKDMILPNGPLGWAAK